MPCGRISGLTRRGKRNGSDKWNKPRNTRMTASTESRASINPIREICVIRGWLLLAAKPVSQETPRTRFRNLQLTAPSFNRRKIFSCSLRRSAANPCRHGTWGRFAAAEIVPKRPVREKISWFFAGRSRRIIYRGVVWCCLMISETVVSCQLSVVGCRLSVFRTQGSGLGE
jgi:hypothetical protein